MGPTVRVCRRRTPAGPRNKQGSLRPLLKEAWRMRSLCVVDGFAKQLQKNHSVGQKRRSVLMSLEAIAAMFSRTYRLLGSYQVIT